MARYAYGYAPTTEDLKSFLRFIMGANQLFRDVMWTLSVFPLGYFAHCGFYVLLTEVLSKKKDKWWTRLVDNPHYYGRAFTLTFVMIAMVVGQLFRRFLGWSKVKSKKGGLYGRVTAVTGPIFRYLVLSSYALLSAWLGFNAKQTQVFMNMLDSFIVFVLMASFAFWTAEDYGSVDAIVAVVLGLLVQKRGEMKQQMFMAGFIPSLRHIWVPFGNFLARWAGVQNVRANRRRKKNKKRGKKTGTAVEGENEIQPVTEPASEIQAIRSSTSEIQPVAEPTSEIQATRSSTSEIQPVAEPEIQPVMAASQIQLVLATYNKTAARVDEAAHDPFFYFWNDNSYTSQFFRGGLLYWWFMFFYIVMPDTLYGIP